MEKFFEKEKIVLTGNPVRQDILNTNVNRDEAIHFFNLTKTKKTILVVGGSLGARGINEAISLGLNLFTENDIQLIWQTGKVYFETAKKYNNQNIKVVDFISRMDLAYAAADLVISRAGAGAISELCIVAKPSILVPLPSAAEDHQTKNAMALVNKNAAVLVKEIDANNHLVNEAIDLIKQSEKLKQLSENAYSLSMPNSTHMIAIEVLKLANYNI